MPDVLTQLAAAIAQGLPEPPGGVRPLLEALFGNRYHKNAQRYAAVRDPLGLDIPYAGFIHPENPTSGAYGGGEPCLVSHQGCWIHHYVRGRNGWPLPG